MQKNEIQSDHKQGDPRLNTMRKITSDEIVRQLGQFDTVVKRDYKLPRGKDANNAFELTNEPEILSFIREQYLTIVSQNGLTKILNELNEISIEDNPNYYRQFITIIFPVFASIREAVEEAITRFSIGLSPNNWSGKVAAEILKEELDSRREELEATLHEQVAHQDISVMVGKLKTFFRNISRALGNIKTAEFKGTRSNEEDEDTKELYAYGEDHILKLYCELRDRNNEKFEAYVPVFKMADLGRLKEILKNVCESLLKPDGFYEIPDAEIAELIAMEFNDSLNDGSINFLLAEDVVSLIEELNWEIQQERATSEQQEQIIEYKKSSLKEMLKFAISEFYENLLTKVVKGTRIQIALQQPDQRPEHISIADQVFLKIGDAFKKMYGSIFQALEDNYDEHIISSVDEINFLNRGELENKLKKAISKFFPDLVAALKGEGIEIEENLNKFLEGTQLNIAALPYNVADLSQEIKQFTPNPDYSDNILKGLLLERFESVEPKIFTPREKKDLKNICRTLTRSTTVINIAEILSKLEEEGRFKEWADQLNKRHHAGYNLRDEASVIKEVTDILNNLADKLSEEKKASRIDEELQKRIDEVTDWAEQYFKDKEQRVADKVADGKTAVYRENPTQKMIRRLWVALTESLDGYSLPDIERMVCKLAIFMNNLKDRDGIPQNDRPVQLNDSDIDDLLLPPKRDVDEAGESTFYEEPDLIQGILRGLDNGILECERKLEKSRTKETELTELRGRLSSVQKELTDAENEITQTRNELSEYTTQINEEMTKGADTDYGLIAALGTKSAEKQQRLKALEDVVDSLQSETTQLNVKIEEYETDSTDPGVIEDLIKAKERVRASILKNLRGIIEDSNAK